MNFGRKLLTLGALTLVLSGCEKIADKYIESYFQRKGPDSVEKAIDEIVKKKRADAQKESNPPIEERLKKRIDVSIKGAPVKGPATASVVIVEFSDFECPFCTRVLPTVQEVMKTYEGKVRLAFRHNPLPFHQNAMPAAKAAMAAHKQGKFWEMHDKLFQNQRELNPKNFSKWAKDLKLNTTQFEKDLKDAGLGKTIEEDANFARSNGAGGTPSFFIGKAEGDTVKGILLVGAQPLDQFKAVIDALIAEKS